MKILSRITILVSILFLSKLIYFGELNFLIHPRYFILIYLAVGILVLTLIFNKKCEEDRQKTLALIPLLIIFTFGSLIDFKPLSSSAQTDVQYQKLADVKQANRDKYLTSFNLKTEELSLSQLVSVFSIDPEPSKYADKPVKLMGFYFETGDGSPMIARHFISCCAADAQLIGLWLTEPMDLKVDTWIEIEGTLQILEKDSARLIAVKADKFKLVDPPKNPYVTE